MGSAFLQLTLTRGPFCLTPLPGHIQTKCGGEPGCTNLATHRLLSSTTGRTQLLCDAHALTWAHEHGCAVTTANPNPSQPAA